MAWNITTPTTSSLFTTCFTPTKLPFLPSYQYYYHTKVTINSKSPHILNSKFPYYYNYYLLPFKKQHTICKAAAATAEYKFPDPIPEFGISETEKFKAHLIKKLTKKNLYGDKLDEVVEVCTEILGNFLRNVYCGPGTLLVLPFIDIADTLNERGLPGGPQAARVAVKWGQSHIDNDWKEWTGKA